MIACDRNRLTHRRMAWVDVYEYVFGSMGGTDRTSWDDFKRDQNVEKHAYDFLALGEVFDGRFCVIRKDDRRDYGETLYNMLVLRECHQRHFHAPQRQVPFDLGTPRQQRREEGLPCPKRKQLELKGIGPTGSG